MAAAQAGQSIGRLANVSAALIVPIGQPTRSQLERITESCELLVRLFEDVVTVGEMPDPEQGNPAAHRTVTRPLERGQTSQSELSDLALALGAAREDRMLILGAGIDFASAKLLLGLTAWPEHECVAARIDEAAQPLCAIYQREVALTAARRRLEGGETDLASFLNQLDCSLLEGDDLAGLLATRNSLS